MRRCARCQAAILFTEMVMRARDLVFHVHCFTCAVCNSTFNKGDQFGLKDSTVLCQIHYELAVSEQQHQSPSPATFPGGGTFPPPFPSPEFHPHHHHASIPPAATPACPDGVVGTKVAYFNGSTTGTTRQKGRPRKRKPKDLETMTANLGMWTAPSARLELTVFILIYSLSFLLSFFFTSIDLFPSFSLLFLFCHFLLYLFLSFFFLSPYLAFLLSLVFIFFVISLLFSIFQCLSFFYTFFSFYVFSLFLVFFVQPFFPCLAVYLFLIPPLSLFSFCCFIL
jgi:hypothetical protein